MIRRFRYLRAATPLLENVELRIVADDFVVVVGKPGSGKSTVCLCLSRVNPHSGVGLVWTR